MLAVAFIGDWPADLRQIGERVLAALQEELGGELDARLVKQLGGEPVGTVNLKLVDDATLASLNKQYSGHTYATDVLTFRYSEDGTATGGELADVAISTEMAARQAHAAGTELSDEVGLLIAHGLLHALGYDHEQPRDRQQMDACQRRLIARAGLNYRDFQWKH